MGEQPEVRDPACEIQYYRSVLEILKKDAVETTRNRFAERVYDRVNRALRRFEKPTPPKETTIIQPALLPCPLCHGAAEYTWNQLYSDNTMATCRSCGCSAFWRKWNTRVQPAPVEQDVEIEDHIQALASVYTFSTLGDRDRAVACMQGLARYLSTLTPARAEGFKAGLTVIADNLVDQRDEPWTEEGGASQNRVHFWRDKAINASRAIRALKESDHG